MNTLWELTQEKSEQVQQRFDAQQKEWTRLSDVVLESRKETQTNAEVSAQFTGWYRKFGGKM